MRRIFTRSNLLMGALAAFAVAGCDSATGNNDPKISLSLTTSTVTLSQGGNQTVQIAIARTNFNSAVALTIDGLPSGVTASFAPVSIPDGATASALELTASGAATPGSSTLTVHATGEGISEQVATIDLTITVTGSFSLAAVKSSVSIAQGGGGMATVLVTRIGGNAGNVSLTATGAPAGVTATFTPATTTETGASLSLAATSSVAPGTYTLTITGTSPSLTDQTTTISLIVIPPPATASLTIPFCAGQMPVWFAYQNEGYVWQQVTPTGTSFSFSATDKLGIVFVFPVGAATLTYAFHTTRAELTGIVPSNCLGTSTVNGAVNTLEAGKLAVVALGIAHGTITGPTTVFTLQNVRSGLLDLVAARGSSAGGYLTPDAIIIRRGISQPHGSTISPLLDFTTESFAPAAFNVNFTGVEPGEEIYFQGALLTAGLTAGLIHDGLPLSGPITLSSVPASRLIPGDIQWLWVDALLETSNAIIGHSYTAYFATPASRDDALGLNLNNPIVTSLGASPYTRMRARLASQNDYQAWAVFGYGQNNRVVYVGVSAAYLGGVPGTWDAEIPDFSGTPGFNANWMLSATPVSGTNYLAQAFSGRAQVLLLDVAPVDGDMIKTAYRYGSTTTTALKAPALLASPPPHVALRPLQYFRR